MFEQLTWEVYNRSRNTRGGVRFRELSGDSFLDSSLARLALPMDAVEIAEEGEIFAD